MQLRRFEVFALRANPKQRLLSLHISRNDRRFAALIPVNCIGADFVRESANDFESRAASDNKRRTELGKTLIQNSK
jgi:hypothetical protein